MKLLAAALLSSTLFAADGDYVRDVEQYRAKREATLKADDGWLTVVGLFRLKMVRIAWDPQKRMRWCFLRLLRRR